MENSLYIANAIDPVDALWSLFLTQSQAVKDAFKERIMEWSSVEYSGDIKAYESCLPKDTVLKAHEIAKSIESGIKEVESAAKSGRAAGRPARELLRELM